MKGLLENIKNFAKTVMEVLHGLWQIRVFKYFLFILMGLIFSTIVYAIKFKGMTAEELGFEGFDFLNISFQEFLNKIFNYDTTSAAAAHRDAHEIIKRFYEATGKVPYGYTI